MLRAIVFDFDGVIANSEPLHLRAFQQVLAEEGVTLSEAHYYARYLGFDDVGVFRQVGEDTSRAWLDADIRALVARKGVQYEALERDVSLLFPGAAGAIRRAAARVPIAVTSGALQADILRVLDREELTALFAVIVSAEDTTASKPAPDPYLHTIARLTQVLREPIDPAQCVALEDSMWGLESARGAGLRTVGVAQTYGAEALASADLVISSIAALDVEALSSLCRG